MVSFRVAMLVATKMFSNSFQHGFETDFKNHGYHQITDNFIPSFQLNRMKKLI